MTDLGDLPIDLANLAGLTDKEFRAPDLIGTVEGWRCWYLPEKTPSFGAAPKLMSVTHNYVWPPRVKARSECRRHPDHVPGEDCTCGFYAAKTLDHLRSMGYVSCPSIGSVTVVGQLAMWGKVIEGTQGWRGEFAYPVKLYVPFEAWRLGRPLTKAYGVPVRVLNLLDPSKQP